MLNDNMELENTLMLLSDLCKRCDNVPWEKINYTDKYNLIMCSRIIKKNMDEAYVKLNQFANIPLEYIQNEQRKKMESEKNSLENILKQKNMV